MLKIGLTGGIASGKSTVAKMFAELGIDIIDSDKIAREVVVKGTPALTKITEHFGEEVLNGNGELDRKKLRARIFNNPDERDWLEKLLHPLIRQTMADKIHSVTSPYCILVIPLLIETLPNPLIDRILVVDVPEEIQIKRVMQRDIVDKEHAKKILTAQVTRSERLDAADDVIENSEDLEFLNKQVENFHQDYLRLS